MGRKDSAGNQVGTARMTVGDRFWARRIRPIFDDGDLTLEQKSVFCCIVARDPMSVAIECPARDIAAAQRGWQIAKDQIRDPQIRFVLLDAVAAPFVEVGPDEGVLEATYAELAG